MLWVSLLTLLFSTHLFQVTHARPKPRGLTLRMHHFNSPNSPFFRPNLTKLEQMSELAEMSDARAQWLGYQSKRNNTSPSFFHPDGSIRPTIKKKNPLYLLKVGIGTFPSKTEHYKIVYLGIDTGGDLTWTQCEGCLPDNCFPQAYPVYPNSRSSSYESYTCGNCPPPGFCLQNTCTHTRWYGDGSSLRAQASRETFTFEADGYTLTSIPHIYFGCGIQMFNFLESKEPGNLRSGMFGMNYGALSFLRQQYSLTQGLFSYCLYSQNEDDPRAPMFLRFGGDVIIEPNMKFTPMLPLDNDYYNLFLEDISVAGQRLNINPDIFKVRFDRSGGTIIDSGTVLSNIVTGAYQVLVHAFKAYFEPNNPQWRLMKDPLNFFPFCYERVNDPSSIDLPSVTLHFANNADFEIDPQFVVVQELGDHKNVACFAFAEGTESKFYLTILGAYQQANKRIVYDLARQQLFFHSVDCHGNN